MAVHVPAASSGDTRHSNDTRATPNTADGVKSIRIKAGSLGSLDATNSSTSRTASSSNQAGQNIKPALSLILCTYQRTKELEALFQSLARQTFKNFEVIVVDQNPDDRIAPYLRRAENAGLDIKHIRHPLPNLSTARNIGIQAARGEWVGFPDDDCWYEADLLEQLSASFTCTEALTGCAARWEELREPADLPSRITWDRSRLFRDRMLVSFMLFFNRKLFDHIGDFDSRLGVGQWFGAGEETDLVLRALRAGAVVTFHPLAKVHHPVKEYDSMAAARQRARGAGALYAKHGLPLWVIMRGLVAPLMRPLVCGARPKEIRLGSMYTLGRWEGMMRWKKMKLGSAAAPVVPAQLASYQQIFSAQTEVQSAD